jgi:hypothetical protein
MGAYSHAYLDRDQGDGWGLRRLYLLVAMCTWLDVIPKGLDWIIMTKVIEP